LNESSKPAEWGFKPPVETKIPPGLKPSVGKCTVGALNVARSPASKIFVRTVRGRRLTFDRDKVWVHCRGCGVPTMITERVYCRDCDPEQKYRS